MLGALTITSGSQTGQTFEIDRELVIGRRDADITIADAEISSRHAAVRPLPGGIGIRDLGSTNGTFVNGQQITAEVLLSAPGTIRVGDTEIVVDPAPAGPATVVPPVPARAVAAPAPPQPPVVASPPAGGPPRRRGLLILGPLVLAAAAVAIVLVVSSGDDETEVTKATAGGIVNVPVEFTVRDQNRSMLQCPASGQTYKIAGRLVAPASGPGSAVTLYLHGVILDGHFEWHFQQVPGYDHVTEMAKLGHTSVFVDRVGYGKTRPIPKSGAATCFGAHADHAHQMISELRTGRFSVLGSSGVKPKSFARVALAGYSLGGTIAQLEAGSFGDPDALIVVSWSDVGLTEYGTPFPVVNKLCSPGRPKAPGGVNGYFPTLPPEKIPPLVSDKADQRVKQAMVAGQQLDPCGVLLTGGAWFGPLGKQVKARITAPVLMIHGVYDPLFRVSGWEKSFRQFTGSRDKERIPIPDGQLVMLDEEVKDFRAKLSRWLKDHGL